MGAWLNVRPNFFFPCLCVLDAAVGVSFFFSWIVFCFVGCDKKRLPRSWISKGYFHNARRFAGSCNKDTGLLGFGCDRGVSKFESCVQLSCIPRDFRIKKMNSYRDVLRCDLVIRGCRRMIIKLTYR